MVAGQINPIEIPDHLIAQGRYWATTKELSEVTGRSPRLLSPSLADLVKDGKLFSPAMGLYVIVPPEYRSWKVVPAEWFIDPMMVHLKRHYYVSFLSAAAMHGAAHQAPQVFQAVVSRPLRDRQFERVRLRFISSHNVDEMATEQATTHTGYVRLATRETTAVDLVWRPQHGAGLSNVATVLRELGELDPAQLARLSETRGRSVARRLGWLLDRFRSDLDTSLLRLAARPEEGEIALLLPGGPKRGKADRRWGVRINTDVEPDL